MGRPLSAEAQITTPPSAFQCFRTIILPLVACVTWGCTQALSRQSAGGCRRADSFSEGGITWLQSFVADTTDDTRSLKRTLGVDAVLPEHVFLVQVDSLCGNAAKSRSAAEGYKYDGKAAYVYKLGSQYVIDAPVAAGWQSMHIQDALFRHVGWLTR